MRVRMVGYIVLCMYNERGRRKSKERQVMGGDQRWALVDSL